MINHEYRLWMNDIFNTLPEAKKIFEEHLGISPENLPTWMLKGGIEAIVNAETSRREEEREDQIRGEEHEFQIKLEKAKLETLRYSLSEVARIIREGNEENAEKLRQLLTSISEGYRTLQTSPPQKMISSSTLVSYADCWRRHDKTEEHPVGRPGPTQCVYTKPEEDGIHHRCLVAYAAQNPGDSGFARLKYQIFHAELLRQGDCPKPLSRSITRRIPVVSWVLTKLDKCPLADGREYVLDKSSKLTRVDD